MSSWTSDGKCEVKARARVMAGHLAHELSIAAVELREPRNHVVDPKREDILVVINESWR